MKRVELFFDFASPYSYLAATQIGDLGRRTGAQVAWRPMALGAVFKAVGHDGPGHIPASKRMWQGRDLQRWAAEYGVPFSFSPYFPSNTIRAMRLVLVDDSRAEAVALAGFRAMWVDGLDLAAPETIAQVAQAGGLDVAAALAAIETPAIKERLKANGEEAVTRGVFGAPTMLVGDELHWGNDRLPFVEATLRLLHSE